MDNNKKQSSKLTVINMELNDIVTNATNTSYRILERVNKIFDNDLKEPVVGIEKAIKAPETFVEQMNVLIGQTKDLSALLLKIENKLIDIIE